VNVEISNEMLGDLTHIIPINESMEEESATIKGMLEETLLV
jgi:hypothetical protein